jgi:hypothetical protein
VGQCGRSMETGVGRNETRGADADAAVKRAVRCLSFVAFRRHGAAEVRLPVFRLRLRGVMPWARPAHRLVRLRAGGWPCRVNLFVVV